MSEPAEVIRVALMEWLGSLPSAEDWDTPQDDTINAALAALEQLTKERDEFKDRIDSQAFLTECANTPLMADVMDERDALTNRVRSLETALERSIVLLGRIRGWDMMDVTADGPYWRAEIDAFNASISSEPTETPTSE